MKPSKVNTIIMNTPIEVNIYSEKKRRIKIKNGIVKKTTKVVESLVLDKLTTKKEYLRVVTDNIKKETLKHQKNGNYDLNPQYFQKIDRLVFGLHFQTSKMSIEQLCIYFHKIWCYMKQEIPDFNEIFDIVEQVKDYYSKTMNPMDYLATFKKDSSDDKQDE